jgi:hypothetical protein
LKFILRRLLPGTATVLIFTDTLPVKQHRDAAEKAIKLTCRAELTSKINFEIYHHPSASNPWIQVADYCSWAVFRKWEHKDTRTYDQLRHRLEAAELDALWRGTTLYY